MVAGSFLLSDFFQLPDPISIQLHLDRVNSLQLPRPRINRHAPRLPKPTQILHIRASLIFPQLSGFTRIVLKVQFTLQAAPYFSILFGAVGADDDGAFAACFACEGL